jgi:cytidylate kinase
MFKRLSNRGKPFLPFSGVEIMGTSKKKGLVIAIDGPSGAGKSTVARVLAKRLGYVYIDTGAMYRTVALMTNERAVSVKDEKALVQLASVLHISFVKEGEDIRVLCDGEDVTEAIRSPEISLLASEISKKKGVRKALVQMQRRMERGGGVVLEGRDIGTVVFPNADVKFYLDAQIEERARRRFKELGEKGIGVDFKGTLQEVMQRDHSDMHRIHSPLKKAADAVLIDSTHRSAEEVVKEMRQVVISHSTRKKALRDDSKHS